MAGRLSAADAEAWLGAKSESCLAKRTVTRTANFDISLHGITDLDQLRENFAMNCIPDGMEMRDFEQYDDFLQQRRKLMAAKIRGYYLAL